MELDRSKIPQVSKILKEKKFDNSGVSAELRYLTLSLIKDIMLNPLQDQMSLKAQQPLTDKEKKKNKKMQQLSDPLKGPKHDQIGGNVSQHNTTEMSGCEGSEVIQTDVAMPQSKLRRGETVNKSQSFLKKIKAKAGRQVKKAERGSKKKWNRFKAYIDRHNSEKKRITNQAERYTQF